MILDRPGQGREPRLLRCPLNTVESTETMRKDDWLMRLGDDHGRTVIMAYRRQHMRCPAFTDSTTLSM
jgi:hypothetical protein